MIYNINPSKMFKSYDVIVIYFSDHEPKRDAGWFGYTYTDMYRLTEEDKKELVDDICKRKK